MVCRSDAVGVPGSVVVVGKIKRRQGLHPCAAADLLFWSAPGPVWHFILFEGREIRPGLGEGAVAWSAPAAAVNVASRIAASNRGWRRPTSWRVTRSRRQCRQIPASRDAVGFVWKGGEGWVVLPGVPKPPRRFGVPLFNVSARVASPR